MSESCRDELALQVLVREHLHVHLQEQSAGSEATALSWRKSSASNPTGNCVEVAALPDGGVAVRNSRHPAGPTLVYTRAEIAAFLTGVRAGEFDDLAS